MATIAEQLTSLADAKYAIKGAIISRGVSVSDTDPLRTYADKIGQIGETVPETKFGVGIDNFLGDVDANGNYIAPSEPVEINLAGVKSVPAYGFAYKFANIRNLVVNANDVTSVDIGSFSQAFCTTSMLDTDRLTLTFDKLEIIDQPSVFEKATLNRNSTYGYIFIRFKSLKKVTANNAFYFFAPHAKISDFQEIFPELEEIGGDSVFNNGFGHELNSVMTAPKIKKITGSTATYSSTFNGISPSNSVWNFPNATEFTGYIWNVPASYKGEIHFAAANQAAIEACEGYDYKWGFQGAAIYFDL